MISAKGVSFWGRTQQPSMSMLFFPFFNSGNGSSLPLFLFLVVSGEHDGDLGEEMAFYNESYHSWQNVTISARSISLPSLRRRDTSQI